jgi:hypothetical protein
MILSISESGRGGGIGLGLGRIQSLRVNLQHTRETAPELPRIDAYPRLIVLDYQVHNY